MAFEFPLDHLTTSVNGKRKCLLSHDDDVDDDEHDDDDVDEKGAEWACGCHSFYYHTLAQNNKNIKNKTKIFTKERKKKVNPLECPASSHPPPTTHSRESHASGWRFGAQAWPKINCQLSAFHNLIRFAKKSDKNNFTKL